MINGSSLCKLCMDGHPGVRARVPGDAGFQFTAIAAVDPGRIA
jgi:hypothetical protein